MTLFDDDGRFATAAGDILLRVLEVDDPTPPGWTRTTNQLVAWRRVTQPGEGDPRQDIALRPDGSAGHGGMIEP